MSKIYDTISSSIDTAYRLPHVAGDVVQKTDLRDAAQIITDGVEAFLDSYPTTPVITANTLTVELDRDRSYGSLELTDPLTIDVNTITALDQKSATLTILPKGNSVAFANMSNAGTEVVDITKQNTLAIAKVGASIKYRIVSIVSDVNIQLPAPVVTGFSPDITTLRFTWSDNPYNIDTEIEISTDGITFGAPISLGASTTSYDITGLTLSDIRYVRVKFIGDGLLYDTSDYSNVASAIVAVSGYKSIVIDNNQSNYLQATPNSTINYGNGTTSDSAHSYSAWFKFSTLKSVNPIISRGSSDGSSVGMVVYADNTNLVFALYDTLSSIIYVRASGVVAIDTWYNIVCTYDGSSLNTGMNIYLNGTLLNVTRFTAGTYVAMPFTNTLNAGKFIQGGTNHIADVILSDIGIYSKELSLSESVDLHNLHANNITSLSFYNDISLYTRLDGDLINDKGTVQFAIVGSLSYSTDGAY